ncbi:MAG TPA: hypothetical protein VHH35_09155 [Pyrinomonadaceae bacterium]|nr:hypothetical protein [Pyrinomonadaceae bacterium]
MPKDAKKNVDRYKIRGGDLNEFEFSKNQAAASKKSVKAPKGATAKKLAAKKATKK